MKNIYPYKQQNDTQHFNSFACYCLKINKYSSATVEDEHLCITTPAKEIFLLEFSLYIHA